MHTDTHTHTGLSLFGVSYSSTIRRIPHCLLFSEALWSADGQHASGHASTHSAPLQPPHGSYCPSVLFTTVIALKLQGCSKAQGDTYGTKRCGHSSTGCSSSLSMSCAVMVGKHMCIVPNPGFETHAMCILKCIVYFHYWIINRVFASIISVD